MCYGKYQAMHNPFWMKHDAFSSFNRPKPEYVHTLVFNKLQIAHFAYMLFQTLPFEFNERVFIVVTTPSDQVVKSLISLPFPAITLDKQKP